MKENTWPPRPNPPVRINGKPEGTSPYVEKVSGGMLAASITTMDTYSPHHWGLLQPSQALSSAEGPAWSPHSYAPEEGADTVSCPLWPTQPLCCLPSNCWSLSGSMGEYPRHPFIPEDQPPPTTPTWWPSICKQCFHLPTWGHAVAERHHRPLKSLF